MNDLINVYGQDLKNEQWLLEPLADVVISFSTMYFGFLRYNQLEVGKIKTSTLPVWKYSIDRHFNKLRSNIKDIHNSIIDKLDDSSKSFNNQIINEFKNLNYFCDSISLKKIICEEFYKNGKYYLD